MFPAFNTQSGLDRKAPELPSLVMWWEGIHIYVWNSGGNSDVNNEEKKEPVLECSLVVECLLHILKALGSILSVEEESESEEEGEKRN